MKNRGHGGASSGNNHLLDDALGDEFLLGKIQHEREVNRRLALELKKLQRRADGSDTVSALSAMSRFTYKKRSVQETQSTLVAPRTERKAASKKFQLPMAGFRLPQAEAYDKFVRERAKSVLRGVSNSPNKVTKEMVRATKAEFETENMQRMIDQMQSDYDRRVKMNRKTDLELTKQIEELELKLREETEDFERNKSNLLKLKILSKKKRGDFVSISTLSQ